MGSVFNESEAQAARYWIQRKVYNWGPGALGTGTTTIFSAQGWQNADQPGWLARLTKIAATQNAGVQLQWIYDGASMNQSQAEGFTDAMPPNLQWHEVDAPAVNFLQLVAVNNTGSPVASFQLNYEIEMQQLSVADKIALGYGLSAQDTQNLALLGSNGLQQIQDQVRTGKRPISTEDQIARFLAGMSQGEDPRVSGIYHVTANASTTEGQAFARASVDKGTFEVLEAVAVPGAQAITLYVNVDNQPSALQISGGAFAQTNPAMPWRVFLPIVSTISVAVSAATTLTAVPVMLRVRKYNLTDLWRVRLGLAGYGDKSVGRAYAEVWAGIA